MGKSSELLSLLKTGNSDAARRLIAKLKKSGKKKALSKELNVPDDNGQTVIHFCAAQNFVEFLQDLAELGASIDIADNKGYTPLHLAATSGRTQAVTALINKGADPNISSRTGDTALHLACDGGHATSVEALVSENANCTMLNVSGHTPLDLACQGGHAQVVSLLLRSGQFSSSYLQRSDMPHTALLLAAKQGHNECIGLLVKHGFDVSRKLPGSNSGTALHEAALYGRVDTVRYLLQCGADVQQTNAQGLTALDIVNMYTDPRSANQMKQVLQDALAHQARSRIAQQHSIQQQPQPSHPPPSQRHPSQPHPSQPHSSQPHPSQPHPSQPHPSQPHPSQPHPSQPHPSHHTPPAIHRQQSGFSYIQSGAHHQEHSLQRQGSAEVPASPHQQPRQQLHTGHSHPGHTHPGLQGRAVGAVQRSSQPHSHTSHHNHPQFQPQQPYYQPPQGQHAGYTSGGPAQRHSRDGQVQASTAHSHPNPHPHPQRQPQPQPQPQTGQHYSQPQSSQAAPVGHVQHIYPQPGTPENVRKATSGIGGDLAAIIAAKAASRRPITTSPTRKEFPESAEYPVGNDHLHRSRTMGDPQSSVLDARSSVLRRHGSVSERSSGSPERSDPPTLPHRATGGPPSFKPQPPPHEVNREFQSSGYTHVLAREEGSASDPLQRRPVPKTAATRPAAVERAQTMEVEQLPRLKKAQPKAPARAPSPTSSADNELLAKLMRRQNKITEAEQTPPPSSEQAPPEEEVQALERPSEPQKPPPPPERKTPLLTSQISQPPPPEPSMPLPPPASVETSTPPSVSSLKPRVVKPPPPKAKEPEPDLTPWQQEIAFRRARLADHEKMQEEEEGKEEPEPMPESNQPSTAPLTKLPPPAPKPKRRDPVPAPSLPDPHPTPSVPQTLPPPPPQKFSPPQELPPPPPPPQELPPPPTLQEPAPPPPPQELPPPPAPIQKASPPPSLPTSQEPAALSEGPPARFPAPLVPADRILGSASVDHLSRSTSLSSLTNTTGTGSPQLSHVDHMAIADWLTTYKLTDYITLLESNGYETTELLMGATQDDLVDMGIGKVGHRKKLLSALSNWPQKEHFFQTKPGSVPEWLSVLGLNIYESVLMEAGYDDIDFISDMTIDDLQDLGVTKRGHIKRFIRGIGELVELLKGDIPIPPTIIDSQAVSSIHSSVNGHRVVPPPSDSTVPVEHTQLSEHKETSTHHLQNSTGQSKLPPEKVDFGKMKMLLEKKMGSNRMSEEVLVSDEHSAGSSRKASHSPSVSPRVRRKASPQPATENVPAVPPRSTAAPVYTHRVPADGGTGPGANLPDDAPPLLPPKKGRKVPPAAPPVVSRDDIDGHNSSEWKKYSVEDITAALDDPFGGAHMRESSAPPDAVLEVGEGGGGGGGEGGPLPTGADDSEFDQLTAALQGFDPETGQSKKAGTSEPEPDQLLADIDDMLADLTTHLDFLIPGST